MSYYKILGLEKEPFSTSPDPAFFYQSRAHKAALTNLLIEARLRRGLSVILGDVGTGKTTLSRILVQNLKEREGIEFHIILDPMGGQESHNPAETEYLFLASLGRIFGMEMPPQSSSPDPYGREGVDRDFAILDLKEAIERHLFKRGVDENKTMVLIIDEAQKLNTPTLEVLRVLLNYETNEYKLLQLILLGQLELYSKIAPIANFMDRISFKYTLNPLDEEETGEMIKFRLAAAGYQAAGDLFQPGAIQEIYRVTRGYPRQVTLLCHKALTYAVMKNKLVIDSQVIKEIVEEEVRNGWRTPHLPAAKQQWVPAGGGL